MTFIHFTSIAAGVSRRLLICRLKEAVAASHPGKPAAQTPSFSIISQSPFDNSSAGANLILPPGPADSGACGLCHREVL
jgi:hypothetical protein